MVESMPLKHSYPLGMVAAFILPIVVFSLHWMSSFGMFALILILWGLWTVIHSFGVPMKDTAFYLIWGLMLIAMSTFFILPLNIGIALFLLVILACAFIAAKLM